MKININNKKIKSLFLLSLVGSSVGQQASENQTEALVPSATSYPVLPQLSTNFTSAEIIQKGPEQNVLIAGYPILVGINGINGTVWNKCTGSFVIVNTNSSQCQNGNDYGGFLTSFFCLPPVFLDPNATQPGVVNWDNSVSLGKLYYGPEMNWNKSIDNYWHLSAEYVYISANLNSVKLLPLVPKTTDEGTTDLLPVIASSNPTSPGLPVCVYGAASGYQCGNITELNLNLAVPNLWIKGGPCDWCTDWMLNNLNKVDLGTNGLLIEDIGAPVYTETQIGDRTLAQALGHVSIVDNNDPQHQTFYYTPLEQTLDGIKNDHSCTYSLLTYNETSSQEYDQLLAQIELPPKK